MIWSHVEVDWCEEWNCWTVGGYDNEGNREHLSEHYRKEEAVDEAMIYAFDTSCGPQRGAKVEVYTKDNKLIKTITESGSGRNQTVPDGSDGSRRFQTGAQNFS